MRSSSGLRVRLKHVVSQLLSPTGLSPDANQANAGPTWAEEAVATVALLTHGQASGGPVAQAMAFLYPSLTSNRNDKRCGHGRHPTA